MYYVTFPTEKEALRISNGLLEEKLIACYNLFPMNSGFWWEDKIDHAIELVAVFKTCLELEENIEQYISAQHSYEIPCIIRSVVRVNNSYGKWIHESVIKI